MKTIGLVLVLAAAFALGTVVVGWWAVPVLGALAGALLGARARPGRWAALAAAVAWIGILAFAAAEGPVGTLARRLAGAMQLPVWGLYAVTLLFPALLAGTAALLGALVRSSDAGRLNHS